ncbi:MAG: recombinase family protein [Microbacteriaceae bacterium]
MVDAIAAAVYARISRDVTGEGLGVERQLRECHELAAKRGWIVAEEYIDNDISPYSGKARPAYKRMLADIADGLRDAVIVYNTDRLTRRPIK